MNARVIDLLQTCPRWALLDADWQTRMRPRLLFDEALQLGCAELAKGQNAEQAALVAVTHFQAFAASPGLACVGDPYVLAMDYCASLQTVLEAVSRTVAETRALYFASIKSFTTDDMSAFCHSWTVAERMAQEPLVNLNVFLIELPSARRGRIHSPWCRAFEHSHIKRRIQFQSKTGKPLVGDWKPFWLAQQSSWSVREWVDKMLSENVRPWRDITLKVLTEKVAEQIREEIKAEMRRFERGPSFRDLPMHRRACDFPEPCPFQEACYGGKHPSELGYLRKEKE